MINIPVQETNIIRFLMEHNPEEIKKVIQKIDDLNNQIIQLDNYLIQLHAIQDSLTIKEEKGTYEIGT